MPARFSAAMPSSFKIQGKRPIEVVDLVSSSDDESMTTAKKVPRRSSGYDHSSSFSTSGDVSFSSSSTGFHLPSSSYTPDVRFSDNRETYGAGNEIVDLSQDNDEDTQHFQSYGKWENKVVGVRYYRGVATTGEVVVLNREPNNPYDSNAVQVQNVMHTQIGHLPRAVASKLASFMDSGRIVIEARLSGSIGQFDAPVCLTIYGTNDPVGASQLTSDLQGAGIPKTVFSAAERERKRREKEIAAVRKAQALKDAASRAKGVGNNRADATGNTGFTNQGDMGISLDDAPDKDEMMRTAIKFNPREIGEAADRYGADEEALSKLPLAKQPTNLVTKLLPYQLQGLAWMLDRENPTLPSRGSEETSQLWKPDRKGKYINVATNYTMEKPTLASGGILADDMGLGKTIQTIALLVADPHPRRQPTLIVSPLSVMSNWAHQADAHIASGKTLNILTYHGSDRKNQGPKDFEQYDIVITTYQTLALEYMPAGQKSGAAPVPRTNGLFSINWRRIVLDEGHSIRSPKAKASQAAYKLMAGSRWVLTGTPIINNLKDLYSHIKFIRLTGGLEQQDVFDSVLVRPLNQKGSEGPLLLRALMITLCLRRKKDMKFINLRLPELTSHRYDVQFQPHERETYEAFAQEAKGLLDLYRRGHNTKGSSTYSHLLEVLLRMRQTCNHWKLCGDRATNLLALMESNKKVNLTPENVRSLQDLLQLSIDQQEDCPICLETLHNPVITACAHAFGGECIERVIETQHKCPMCRQRLQDTGEIVQPRSEDPATDAAKMDPDASSSKIDILIGLLKSSRKESSANKTVVFSQWTSFLNVLTPHLQRAGFKFCRLDGTMNADKRDAAMAALEKDPACTVMLASLGVCSVGLNLVAANQVILADSWWAPAIEDQAVDRVHRLGQTRPTSVIRLVMADSIEQRVLDIQSEKRKLMMAAFGEKKNNRNEKKARMGDLEHLLR